MKFAHIIRKLYAEPLLIEESAWRAFFIREELRSWSAVNPRTAFRLSGPEPRLNHPATA
jgi:hypothetical protein